MWQFFGNFFKFGSLYSQILNSTLDYNALYGLPLGIPFGPSVAKSRVSSQAKIFLIFWVKKFQFQFKESPNVI